MTRYGPSWRVYCSCGRDARTVYTAGAMERAMAWFRSGDHGTTGNDHVPSWDYVDARLVPNERNRGKR